MAENNKTRFFYVLYSDKTRVFDQSERAYYPIYIINIYIHIYSLRHRKCSVRGYIHELFVSKPERVRAFDTNNE